jgi:hypothetical protein
MRTCGLRCWAATKALWWNVTRAGPYLMSMFFSTSRGSANTDHCTVTSCASVMSMLPSKDCGS